MVHLLITDIDGTLANDGWRANIDDYNELVRASIDDEPIMPIVTLVRWLISEWTIVCVTHRSEQWRELTNDWLLRHSIYIELLFMRAADDWRTAPAYKVATVQELLQQLNPTTCLLLDSRADVITAYRAEGWRALQS